MSDTLDRVKRLVASGEIRVSDHGYDELVADSMSAREVVAGVVYAVVVEDYPEYAKGPCTLVLQKDKEGLPIHVVWGITRGRTSPAVLVTAYRPARELWEDDLLRRRK